MDFETQQKLVNSAINGKEICFTFSFPGKKVITQINAIFAKILSKLDRIFLLETIITILRECILNAAKANSKRLFFELKNANINDPVIYADVIQNFKKEIIGNFEEIKDDLEKSSYKINFKIKNINDDIIITIENNSPILPTESARINQRIENAKKYEDFAQAYEQMYDETEGAGLGIILTILLLKNCGIPAENFSLTTDSKKTYTHLKIPHDLKTTKIISKIKDKITNEIEILPTLPTSIAELIEFCDRTDVNIDFFTTKINQDPSLAADILKTANSAAFIPVTRIDDLHQALMRIGLKNLKSLLIAVSTQKILEKRYKSFEKIWEHCMKVAFYSRCISEKFKNNKLIENIAISSLLHDVGKIVLLSINTDLTTWIADFMKNRKIRTSTILEEVSLGISHSLIGKLLAEKWNFPEYLMEAILYHHTPLSASKENRDIVDTVYLSNIFCGIENRKYDYNYIEEEILIKFDFIDIKKFNEFHEELKNKFDLHKKK